MKVIVLCGGLGTRLGDLTRETPKPLVLVAGKPFLTYVLDQILVNPLIDEIILAVSFQWEKIFTFIGYKWKGIPVSYSVEKTPLGTGGAILHAMNQAKIEHALVMNGDTLLQTNSKDLIDFSIQKKAQLGIALKKIINTDRFGRVLINDTNQVISFEEKQKDQSGLINSGLYYLKKEIFNGLSASFSFEHDVLASRYLQLRMYGMPTEAYFIDMGVPEDLKKVNSDLLK